MDHKKYRVVFHPEIPQDRVDAARNVLYPNVNLDAYSPEARDTVEFTMNNIVRQILHRRDVDPNFGKPEYRDLRGMSLIDALTETGLARSRRDARRLCEQGGIRVNDVRVTSLDDEVRGEAKLQVGKKRRAYVIL